MIFTSRQGGKPVQSPEKMFPERALFPGKAFRRATWSNGSWEKGDDFVCMQQMPLFLQAQVIDIGL
ncbi:hypothetical protein FJU08_22130 [Martelella alba]|uniref:Uncharacterized protein n=1 Tax=Martelella alba TaxID=2590451 RepID=A0A506TYV2_9HYPH|nr:hypothetical protein [Martelella alba]TPW26496.1 hypothetical protein FJU08_22130 [Martelella alba]